MPSGTPRRYRLHFGLHVLERQTQRGVTREDVEEAVRCGTERTLPGRGNRGGVFRSFLKRIGARKIIVIAELIGNECYLITTYEEGPDPTRN